MIKKNFEYGVLIGRFQPFHLGHLWLVEKALERCEKCIIVLGSHAGAPSVKNPWTSAQRKQMILKTLKQNMRKKVHFISVRDRIYNEALWKENVTKEISKVSQGSKSVCLIGHEKDKSSYYLKIFPQYPFLETGNHLNINATEIRQNYFSKKSGYKKYLTKSVIEFLEQFKKSKLFQNLLTDFKMRLEPKTFLPHQYECILKNGSYLGLIKRKRCPGLDLYMLPQFESNKPISEQQQNFESLLKFFGIKRKLVEQELNSKKSFTFKKIVPSSNLYKPKTIFILECEDELENPNLTCDIHGDIVWVLRDEIFEYEQQMYFDTAQILKLFKLF